LFEGGANYILSLVIGDHRLKARHTTTSAYYLIMYSTDTEDC